MSPSTPTPSPARPGGLTKAHTLRRSQDFSKVFNAGTWGTCPELRLVLAPNGLPLSRFGFSVSKRFGNAVARNLTKRRMREATRHILSEVPCGFDVVLLPSKHRPKPGFAELREVLPRLIRRTVGRHQHKAKGARRDGRR